MQRDWSKVHLAALPGALVGLIPILSPVLSPQQKVWLSVAVAVFSWLTSLWSAMIDPRKDGT